MAADSRSTRTRKASRSPSSTARTTDSSSSALGVGAGWGGRCSVIRDLHAGMPAESSAGCSAMIGGLVPGHDLAFVTSPTGRTDHCSSCSSAGDVVAAAAGAGIVVAAGARVPAVVVGRIVCAVMTGVRAMIVTRLGTVVAEVVVGVRAVVAVVVGGVGLVVVLVGCLGGLAGLGCLVSLGLAARAWPAVAAQGAVVRGRGAGQRVRREGHADDEEERDDRDEHRSRAEKEALEHVVWLLGFAVGIDVQVDRLTPRLRQSSRKRFQAGGDAGGTRRFWPGSRKWRPSNARRAPGEPPLGPRVAISYFWRIPRSDVRREVALSDFRGKARGGDGKREEQPRNAARGVPRTAAARQTSAITERCAARSRPTPGSRNATSSTIATVMTPPAARTRSTPTTSASAPPTRFATGISPIEVSVYRLSTRPRRRAGTRTWMSVFVVE